MAEYYCSCCDEHLGNLPTMSGLCGLCFKHLSTGPGFTIFCTEHQRTIDTSREG